MKKQNYLIITKDAPHQICGFCEDFNIYQETFWYNGKYGLSLSDIQDNFNQPIKLIPITPEMENLLFQ